MYLYLNKGEYNNFVRGRLWNKLVKAKKKIKQKTKEIMKEMRKHKG